MNKYPLISITIPCYNHEKYVEECLYSALEQDYPNKELIIINDGSKDNSSAVINAWIEKNKDKIPVTFIDRENRGIPKTANELIERSNGEYLVGLASDDKLLPGSITKRYEYLRDNPDKLAVIGDCEVTDTDGNILFKSALDNIPNINREIYTTEEGLRKQLIAFKIISGPILMVKKSLFEVIGKYDENLRAEDYDFYLKVAAGNLIGYVDYPVGQYRQHNTNHMSNCKGLINYCIEAEKSILKNMKRFKGYKLELIKAIISFRMQRYLKIKQLYVLEGGPDDKFITRIIVSTLRFFRSIKDLLRR
ncbi:MAG TPA: glycosyltransferase [Candidatus Gastranaerophilales bacterium]|nr:glycosyltransferase [Candidatus Gastranaerophilales bacterium]